MAYWYVASEKIVNFGTGCHLLDAKPQPKPMPTNH